MAVAVQVTVVSFANTTSSEPLQSMDFTVTPPLASDALSAASSFALA